MTTISAELYATTLATLLTGLLWVPVILNRLMEMGLWAALKNPRPDTRPEAEWAWRLDNAHRNALENLALFAPLAIIIHILQIGDATTAFFAYVYVAARVAHALIYTFGIPLFRTLSFAVGFASVIVFALHIFGIL